ncbi:MAG: hypothetical protein LBU85_02810 [Treponema sp.]|nr:hypothetical protein [Treponema sp.]
MRRIFYGSIFHKKKSIITLFPAFLLALTAYRSEPPPRVISTPNLLELPDFIYAAGYIQEGDNLKPCYWHGTNRIDLPVPIKGRGSSEAITVVDGIWISCYWQGTKRIDLPVPDGDASSFVNAISVVNGIVYTTGFYECKNCWKPCFWQDTDRIDLPTLDEISRSEVNMYINSNGDIIISNEIICIAACTGSTIYYWENNILNYSGTIGSGGVISGVCINK